MLASKDIFYSFAPIFAENFSECAVNDVSKFIL